MSQLKTEMALSVSQLRSPYSAMPPRTTILGLISQAYGNTPLGDTAREFMLAKIADDISQGTTRNYMISLHGFAQYAQREGLKAITDIAKVSEQPGAALLQRISKVIHPPERILAGIPWASQGYCFSGRHLAADLSEKTRTCFAAPCLCLGKLAEALDGRQKRVLAIQPHCLQQCIVLQALTDHLPAH